MRSFMGSIFVVLLCIVTTVPIWPVSDRLTNSLAAEDNSLEAGKKLPASASVTLREGSCIHGVPSLEKLDIEAEFGKVQIPLEQVSEIVFDEDGQKVVAKMHNGDTLHGKLDGASLELSTVFGRIAIPRKQLLKLTTDGVVVSGDRHRILFLSDNVRSHFTMPNATIWKIEGEEFVCRSKKNRGEECMLTYKTSFQSIDRVLIRGQVMPPNQNFRLSVGPINMIFNWECADENHYRNEGVLTLTKGHALQSGKVQSIVFEQQGPEAVVFVNDREVYRTNAVLKGTVTIYSAEGGVIGLSELDIKGKADASFEVHGPSHKLNY